MIRLFIVFLVLICCNSCSNVSRLSYGELNFNGTWQKVGSSAPKVDSRTEAEIVLKKMMIDSVASLDPLNLTYGYGDQTLVLRGDRYTVKPEKVSGVAKLKCETVDTGNPEYSFHSCILSLDSIDYEIAVPFDWPSDTLHLNRRIDEFNWIYSYMVRLK